MSLIIRAGTALTAAHMQAMTNRASRTFTPGGLLTTTSSTFATLGSLTITDHPKTFDITRIRCSFHTSLYVTGAGTTTVEYQLLFGANAQVCCFSTITVVDSHIRASQITLFSGVPAGLYTNIPVQWRRVSGTGTVSMDTDDRLSLALWEVRE